VGNYSVFKKAAVSVTARSFYWVPSALDAGITSAIFVSDCDAALERLSSVSLGNSLPKLSASASVFAGGCNARGVEVSRVSAVGGEAGLFTASSAAAGN